jgi:hypothetical protein
MHFVTLADLIPSGTGLNNRVRWPEGIGFNFQRRRLWAVHLPVGPGRPDSEEDKMNHLERDKVLLEYRLENLWRRSEKTNEEYAQRDAARNLLPYVEQLIAISARQIECERITNRIRMANSLISKVYEFLSTLDVIAPAEINEQQALTRASAEYLESNSTKLQLEVEAIRVEIAKEASKIIEYMDILEIKYDRLLLSGLPEEEAEAVRRTARETGHQIRYRTRRRLFNQNSGREDLSN